MSKKFKLVTSYEEPSSSAQTDWSLCLLCQKQTKETLTCPANNGNPSLRTGMGLWQQISQASMNSKPSQVVSTCQTLMMGVDWKKQ